MSSLPSQSGNVHPRPAWSPCRRPSRERFLKLSTGRHWKRRFAFILCTVSTIWTPAAFANNFGESLAWQFRTSTDRVNQASLLDLIEKKRGGYYTAPVYATNIARQYNCSVAANATGNSNGQSAIANSPTVTGASATAAGNSSTTVLDASRSGAAVDGAQTNSGTVTAGVTGSTETVVHGVAWQALNSTQSNSGSQSASVQGSSACAFGVLN